VSTSRQSNVLFDSNRACTACPLRDDCQGPVPAEGPMDAEVMFIGEAPGYNEDKKGFPFRGAAGQYFDSLLRMIGVDREEVFVSNTTKCRPKGNRTPTPEEVQICASRWLDVELMLVQPKVIVPMGDPAIKYFLGEGTVGERHGVPVSNIGEGHLREPINNGELHAPDQSTGERGLESPHGLPARGASIGKGGATNGTIVFPTYHPAAGLHNPKLMIDIQEDFLGLREVLDGTWKAVEDKYPEPIYCSDYATPAETVKTEINGGFWSVDTEIVDEKLWSVQVADKPGFGLFIPGGMWDGKLGTATVHNYLFDAQYIDFPDDTRDTMLMAYLLGLPQGLKELAKRLCGMEMDSYLDITRKYGKEKAIRYLEQAVLLHPDSPLTEAQRKKAEKNGKMPDLDMWPDPPLIEDIVWNKSTNTLGVSNKKPQHITKKIKRILADVHGGKRSKDGNEVDPYTRWNNIDGREREAIQRACGSMPQGDLRDAPREDAVYYSCRDADAGLRVHNKLWPLILERGLLPVYMMDQATLPVALEMMKTGIKIDVEGLRGLSEEFVGLMKEKAEEIFTIVPDAGRFNPNSDTDLRILFFTLLGLTPTKLTKTGLPSVAGEELAKIDHPVVKPIEEYRHLAHLKDSFCDTLPGKADGESRVHPTIRTTRTATGRWAMADPNCQQIPVRTELGRRVREQFIASPGNTLLAIDYSQIELRVAAHLSQCKSMMEAFLAGRDIHTETACRLFGVEEPTSSQRYAAKTLNFGVIYGISAQGFQAQMEVEGLDWTVNECGLFIQESNELRPELWAWQEETKAFAIRNGYVSDMFGRRRLLPEILCPVKWIKSSGEREAINMPVQGGAQGIIKLAMGKLWRDDLMIRTLTGGYLKWLLQIHDELLWEMPNELVPTFLSRATQIMESIVHLSVPLKVESKSGSNWGQMFKLPSYYPALPSPSE
jgi:uracil-DNA glycosylase family 4